MAVCECYIALREKLRPYIKRLIKAAHEEGSAVIRPLFNDYPGNETAWDIDDQYMFGFDILVAPVLYEGLNMREVYIPENGGL